ncbi:putative transmembrane protein, partial [Cryptosporidium sp. chipmunk genotype I]|uniref:putative transmembrane protein n=1 Tax=Cryptosporidium sp. chipmunk genotype I TaxID=1280935 RepID=UPI00351A26E6
METNLSFRYFLKSNISRVYYFYVLLSLIPQVMTQSKKRKLAVDSDIYTTKT